MPTRSHARLALLLRLVFERQAHDVWNRLSLDLIDRGQMPDLTGWVRAVAEAVKPAILDHYQAGMLRAARWRAAQLYDTEAGLKRSSSSSRPDYLVAKEVPNISLTWDFHSPEVIDAVDEAAYKFSRDTLATATTDLEAAIKNLKAALKEGLERGQALGWLSRKVQSIFADPYRAFRIAATESSRAMHSGQLHAARKMGATHKTWLAAPGSACERCRDLDGKTVPINEPFAVDKAGGPYAVVQAPPLHPFCSCDCLEEM